MTTPEKQSEKGLYPPSSSDSGSPPATPNTLVAPESIASPGLKSCKSDGKVSEDGRSLTTSLNPRDEKPMGYWKTHGYPKFVKALSPEPNYFLVRKFAALNFRVALALQDEIVQLESELECLDTINAEIDDPAIKNGSFRDDLDGERRELVGKTLPAKLTEYNNFINSYSQLSTRRPAAGKDRKMVEKWFAGFPRAIDEEESAYIKHEDDLIAVLAKEKSFFRYLLELTLVFHLPVFRRPPGESGQRSSNDKDLEKQTEDLGVIYPYHTKVEGFAAFVMAIIGLAMLISPLWVLNLVTSTQAQLGVITGFVFLFFVLVTIATNAKISESLASTAAYSAVLMVFLQIGVSAKVGGAG